MTKAEEMELTLSKDPDYDVFETATIHRTKNDDVVCEYADGSILSFAEEITNSSGGSAFVSMDEMLESMSDESDVDAGNILNAADEAEVAKMGYCGRVVTVEGTVSDAGWHYFVDLPFELTEVTRDGVAYPSTSRWEEEHGDVYPIAYTAELAANVGNRVRVRCLVSTFRERKSSTRGVPYFVDVDYLRAPMVLAVVSKPEREKANA